MGGNALIGDAGTGTLTQNARLGTDMKVGLGLVLGVQATGNGTYVLSDGTQGHLTVEGNEVVGDAGHGAFRQSGGTNQAGAFLILGSQSGSQGTYELNGGFVTARRDIIGNLGTGEFTQNGGHNGIFAVSGVNGNGELVIGARSSGTGTYTLNSGSLSANTIVLGGNVIGAPDGGVGTFNQNGGAVGTELNPISTLTVGGGHGGQGTYNLSAGSLTVGNATIGDQAGSTGTFTQTGGTHTVQSDLAFAVNPGSTGTYDLQAGTLTVNGNITTGNGTSSLFIGNGTLSVGGGNGSINITNFVLGSFIGSNASFTLSGTGSVTADNETIGLGGAGTFTQTGGTHAVTTSLLLGQTVGSSGNYVMQDGFLYARSIDLGPTGGASATFKQTGGTIGVATVLSIGDGNYELSDPRQTGNVSLTAGVLTLGGITDTATFTQSGGSVTLRTGLAVGDPGLGGPGGSAGRGFGEYTLQGGSLSVQGAESIGANGGKGDFIHSGGSHTITGFLQIGTQGQGSYSLSDANNTGDVTLSVVAGSQSGVPNPAYGNETIGDGVGNKGVFSQFGGTHSISGFLLLGVGGGTGNYTLQAGTLGVGGNETIGGEESTDPFAHTGGNGTFTQSGGIHVVNRTLVIGGSGTGRYDLSGTGSLTVANETIGDTGTGTFSHTGGTHGVTGSLIIGQSSGGSGTYELSMMSNPQVSGLHVYGGETIGGAGTGTFMQTGGAHTVAGGLILGLATGSQGTYSLSGTGSLTVDTEIVGAAGTGTFNQSGGTNRTSALGIGLGAASSTYNLSGGSLFVSTETIGNAGTGTFAQTGGAHTIGVSLTLGQASGSGTYQLSGFSQLNVFGFGQETIGDTGSGKFIQIGGQHNITSDIGLGLLTLGNQVGGVGQYIMGGGMLIADAEIIGNAGTGTFTQIDGDHTVRNSMVIGQGNALHGINGTYNLSGGTLTVTGFAGMTIQAAGVLNYSGGSLNATVTNNGHVNVTGLSPRTFNGDVTNNGVFKVASTTAVFNGTFTNNGAYNSDPATNIFRNLTVGTSGYLVGGRGDVFSISGNFLNMSTQSLLWQTGLAELDFTGSGTHLFTLAGQVGAGFNNNFAWGTLSLAPTVILNLGTGSGNALYVGLLEGLIINGNLITNIFGGPDVFLFYDPSENPGLTGTYFLTGGGLLEPGTAPVPEPSTMLLLASGLAGVALWRWRVAKMLMNG